MFLYSCFGERVASAFPLPLEAAPLGTSSVSILPGVASYSLPNINAGLNFELRGRNLQLYYADAGNFVLDPTGHIYATALQEPPSPFFYRFIAMNMLGLLLMMRGRLVLHGSGVATTDGQALIVGKSGAGKSTLTLALHAAGYPLVCDDVAVINIEKRPYAERGVPYVKAWGDALHTLNIPAQPLEQLSAQVQKRLVPFTPATLAGGLRRIYVLEPAERVTLEPMPFAGAFEHLVRHTFMPRGLELVGQQQRHFADLASLLRHVEVYRITRTSDFTSLAECVALIGDKAR
ncbi:MAG: hypothetical protein AAGJ10_14895 [Bacteroidota bacterium]